jgi:2-polyprenyl-6-methoxyphenol hydroxylase-like FAD-dependent oxidoreductase
LLRERAPWFEPKPEQLCWGAIAPFEQWLVPRFGQGRIWLAGDAAHSTSPIGFQSMNRGFCEAGELARLIAAVLYDADPGEQGFERFERAQRSEWRRLFGLSPEAMPGSLGADLAPCLPASGGDFEALAAMLSSSPVREPPGTGT